MLAQMVLFFLYRVAALRLGGAPLSATPSNWEWREMARLVRDNWDEVVSAFDELPIREQNILLPYWDVLTDLALFSEG